MARQPINIGSSANDGTGDPLRTAFDKINDNFVELYGSDNDLNTLDANLDLNNFVITTGVTNGDITVTPNGTGNIKLGAMKFNGTTLSSDDSTIININEGLVVMGTASVSGATTLSGTLAVGTSLALATGATVTGIDNGALGSSATLLATQGAIKTYVDAQVTAQDLDLAGDSGTGAIDLDSQSLTIAGGTGLTSVAGSQTVTLNIDATVATLTGSQTLTNKILTNPTINAATMTGAVAIDGVTIDDNTITANASNADLELDGSGSGQTRILANATVAGTLNTADVTTTGNTTVSGSLTTGTFNVGDLNIDASGKITTDTNGDVNIDPAGTGAIVLTGPITHAGTQTTTGQLNVDNLRLDGNVLSATSGSITLTPADGQNVTVGGTNTKLAATEANFTLMEAVTVRTDTLSTDTSNADLTIGTQGTGNIVLDTETIARTGNVSFDVSGYVVIDAGAGDIYLKDDGTNFAILSNSAGNLEIKSGNTTALSMTGANVAAQGDLTVSGAFIGSRQAISGAGAINLTTLFTELTTTGADAYSLANGTVGQVKIITMAVDGGNATITPTTFANGTSITMDAVHDSVTLIYGANGWVVLASQNITINA